MTGTDFARPAGASAVRNRPQACPAFDAPAVLVAAELGLSENAIILAKSRVLKRLREEAGDLLG